jgi:Na+/H+-dicarboxylate symporter
MLIPLCIGNVLAEAGIYRLASQQVDELMDMGRSAVNLMGNCLATIVVARWEGDFDDNRARTTGVGLVEVYNLQ